MTLCFDVIIIGAGISGMTAAIYLKRSGINPLLIETSSVGGQINLAYKVENYPGFDLITGRELSKKIFDQISNLEVKYVKEKAIDVVVKDDSISIKCDSDTEYSAKRLIVATGRRYKKLGIKNANKYVGSGLSYCATCDGRFFKDKEVIVVGENNKAIEESIYLSNICSKVTILCKYEKLLADDFYKNKVSGYQNIEILYNTVLTDFQIENDVIVGGTFVSDGKDNLLSFSACFVYNGYEASSELVNNIVKVDDDGYIIVDNKCHTSVNNIYACGDVVKKDLYQLVTAASEGAIAATACIEELA